MVFVLGEVILKFDLQLFSILAGLANRVGLLFGWIKLGSRRFDLVGIFGS
jgi:hypothetical protein